MLFTIIVIIAIIAAVLLGFIVLLQNPKGGGLSGTFGGAANQIFGYKRTTDDVEKITWGLVILVFALCLGAAAMKPVSSDEPTNSSTQANRPSVTTTVPAQPEGNTAEPIEGEDPQPEQP